MTRSRVVSLTSVGRAVSRLGLVSLCVACAGTVSLLSFSVTRDALEDPFPGATAVEVSVRQDGVRLPRAVARTALSGEPFATPVVPFGTGYTLRVDVLDGELLLARGTSATFATQRSEQGALPDVFVAPLGRFAQLATRSAPTPVAAARVGDALVVGNADGSVSRVDAHTALTDELLAPAAGRRFVALPSGLLVTTGGDAWFFDDDAHATVAAELARHGPDALLVPMLDGTPGEPCGFALGGRTAPQALTRLCVVGGVLEVEPLPDVGLGGWGGVGVHVSLGADGGRLAWVGRQDAGGTSSALTLVDPGAPQDTRTVALDLPTTGAAVIANAPGELLVVGGRSAAGVVLSDVARVVVQASGTAVRAVPAPEPLFSPRQGGAAAWVADGVYLVYGGTNAGGAAVRRAELVDVRGFPGVVAPTGELPVEASVVAPVDDHALVAIGASAMYRYAAPRGFE